MFGVNSASSAIGWFKNEIGETVGVKSAFRLAGCTKTGVMESVATSVMVTVDSVAVMFCGRRS